MFAGSLKKNYENIFDFCVRNSPKMSLHVASEILGKILGGKLLPRNRVTGSVGFADSREDEAPHSSLPAKS